MNDTEGYETAEEATRPYWYRHAREALRNKKRYDLEQALSNYNATDKSVKSFLTCLETDAAVKIEKSHCDIIFPMDPKFPPDLNKKALEGRYHCYWRFFNIHIDYKFCAEMSDSLDFYFKCLKTHKLRPKLDFCMVDSETVEAKSLGHADL